jgi:hypothetical protein
LVAAVCRDERIVDSHTCEGRRSCARESYWKSRCQNACVGIYGIQIYFSGVSEYMLRKCYKLYLWTQCCDISASCDVQEPALEASTSATAASTPAARRRG